MFDFIGKRRIWFLFSGALIALGIFAFAFNAFVHGKVMSFGIDFTGGTFLHLRFPEEVTVGEIRSVLAKYNLGQSVIQREQKEKKDIFIRSEPIAEEVRIKLLEDFKQNFGGVELLEADMIGPVIGKELRTQALWAFLIASLGIIIYVSFRFEFKYAVAALLALYHDAIITTGIIALLWRNVDTPFIAAILTIMGYSINDTIVIFDRIRENLKKFYGKKKSLKEIINLSISETIARSINAVLTTLIMVLALLFLGGETIKDFALTLLIGFVIGTYSSIFIASPIVAVWEARK